MSPGDAYIFVFGSCQGPSETPARNFHLWFWASACGEELSSLISWMLAETPGCKNARKRTASPPVFDKYKT